MGNTLIEAIRRYCSRCLHPWGCAECVFAEYRRRDLFEKGCALVFFEAFGEDLPGHRQGRLVRPAA